MRRRFMLLPALALALVLIGCGSDDDSSDDGDTTTTEATDTADESTGDEGTDEPAATDEPDGSETTEGTETTAGDDGGEFCVAYTALEDADDSPAFTQEPESVQDYVDAFGQFIPLAQDALAVAPAEIEDDLAALVDRIEQLVDELEGASDLDEAETIFSRLLVDDELDEAGDRVDDYYESTCPQAADGSGPADDPSTGGAPATVSTPDAED